MGKSNRIEWIDFAKGIGIVSVIISHTINDGVLRGIIFSVHMPLFFILTLLTYKLSSNLIEFKNKTQKAFKYLIFPALLVWIIQVFLKYRGQSIDVYLFSQIKSIFWASGVKVQPDIPALGIPWFLVVLFLSRTIYDYLRLYFKYSVVLVINIVLAFLGVFLGVKGMWLPFSFDIALIVLLLYSIGEYLKQFDFQVNKYKYFMVTFLIWITTFLIGIVVKNNYLEYATREYPLFPMSYFTAIAGVIMIIYISVILLKYKDFIIYSVLSKIGKYSMPVLIIHAIEDGSFRFISRV